MTAHWHKPDPETSAVFDVPPACCTHQFEKERTEERNREHWQHREALTAQRRELIVQGIDAIAVYGEAAASVLGEADAALARKVAAEAIKAFKRVACICPWLDISTLGEGENTRLIRGRDGRCGMHDEETS